MKHRRVLYGLMGTAVVVMSVALLIPHLGFVRHNVLPAFRQSVPMLFHKLSWEVAVSLSGNRPQADQVQAVRNFFRLSREIQVLDEEMRIRAAEGSSTRDLEIRRDALQREQEALRLAAEAILQRQVAMVLTEEGFDTIIGPLPPPLFTVTDAYFILVASPRDRLEIVETRFLGRDLSISQEIAAEEAFDAQYPHLVSLVRPLGGLAAFYPAILVAQDNLRQLLQLSVHEWLHQHLFLTTPLGRRYFQGGPLLRINETVASMIGREIGDRVYLRFYVSSPEETQRILAEQEHRLRRQAAGFPVVSPPLPSVFPGETLAEPLEDERFDEILFLRQTREEVERMLEEGRIREAEITMESRRKELVARGFPIRKLNQAYFAFHGNYADRPDTVDPIGAALAELRLQTKSPKEFLRVIGNVTSLDELVTTLEDWEIFPTPQ